MSPKRSLWAFRANVDDFKLPFWVIWFAKAWLSDQKHSDFYKHGLILLSLNLCFSSWTNHASEHFLVFREDEWLQSLVSTTIDWEGLELRYTTIKLEPNWRESCSSNAPICCLFRGIHTCTFNFENPFWILKEIPFFSTFPFFLWILLAQFPNDFKGSLQKPILPISYDLWFR